MPALNMRLAQPRLLIDINRLDALAGISLQGATGSASVHSPGTPWSPVRRS